ncbi:MAG: penicillin-binding protein 1A [Firmicutes bacterium]|nr:penicillin-binding protein 1A [Bacillota bacterium]
MLGVKAAATMVRLIRNLVLGISIVAFLTVSFTIGSAIGIVAGALKNMPRPEDIEYRPSESTMIYDINGRLITRLYVENRTWVPLSEIPKNLRNAIIATEDSRFYEHHGIDVIAVARAIVADIRHAGLVQGASTITMQLARNAFLTLNKTFTRKLQEVLYAIQLERRYTKDQILELYLNEIYLGHGAYGVEAASQLYFGKHVRDLTLPECALLAGLPRGPNYYSPYENLEAARNRRDTVLAKMREQGYITAQDEADASRAPIRLAGLKPNKRHAAYFIDYILQHLLEQYGQDRVYKGGLKVYTTLDLDMQKVAEKALNDNLPSGRKDSKGLTQPQGALVAIDPSTGYIKAMVGGRGEDKFNRAVQSYRQPGSAFKPFIYTAAIDKGYTPATIMIDSPVEYAVSGSSTPWKPKNYDNKFRGPIPLRQALEQSVNVVAVKLLDEIGVSTGIEYAKRMGITSLVESGSHNDRNLSLVLGGLTRGVTPLEMARAYAVLASGGILAEPISILKVQDPDGNVLEEYHPVRRAVLDEKTAYIMTDMLKGVIERGTGKAANIDRPAAGKTGTTSDNTNAWFVGYTPDLVAAVWIGNDIQSRPLIYRGTAIGSSRAAQIWGIFMKSALRKTPPRDFPVPAGIDVGVSICKDSGLLATPQCPNVTKEVFIKGTEPTTFCNIHGAFITARICTESGKLATGACPEDKVVTKTYLKESGAEMLPDGTIDISSKIPREYCDIHQGARPAGATGPTAEGGGNHEPPQAAEMLPTNGSQSPSDGSQAARYGPQVPPGGSYPADQSSQSSQQ